MLSKYFITKIMWYSGGKGSFVEDFNTLTSSTKYSNYYEPFLGSGAIFLNVKDQFDVYNLNDFNKEIVSIWEFFRDYTYLDLCNIRDEMFSRFGNTKDSKKSYYNIREYYNTNYWNTNKPDKGGYLYLLVNSCLNSFARFGPNGFNQSYGARFFFVDEKSFNYTKNKLKKSIITSKSYTELDYSKESLVFLDPPYFKRDSSYSNNFNENDLKTFIDFVVKLDELDCNIVYTDIESIESDVLLNLNFNKQTIRDIINTSATKHKEVTGIEVCYYNFNKPQQINQFEDWI